MKWTLEVVVVPVSDVDRAKAFYAEQVGFEVDHDTRVGPGQRVVQLTPPGSGCSIVLGEGIVPHMPPGSLRGLQLVVPDRARRPRRARGPRGGRQRDPRPGANPTPQPDPLDNVGFCFFADPDGNAWAVQQISARA
jgi:catechol 2,3-dioxygenase-like lactoylglutathione lyase family enzyme